MTVVLGHRGGRGEGFPLENTLEAFARAFAEGADGVELDVRLCASGEPVVMHDPSLSRVTGGFDGRHVHDVPLRDLPALPGGLRIPTLEEALEACRGRLVNVELKSDVPERVALVRAAVAAVLRGPRASWGKVVFSSFDPRVVAAAAAFAPDVPRSILVGRTTPLSSTLPFAMRTLASGAHVEDAILTPKMVARLRRLHMRVAAWTVDEPNRARDLAAMGVTWIITDRPGEVIDALRLNPHT